LSSREPPQIPEYRLHLDIEFDRSSWTGTLEFPQISSSEEWELDSDGLDISAVRRGPDPIPFRLDRAEGRLSIGSPGGGPLTVEFAGRAAPKSLIGLYRCPHGAGSVLTTQCEPVGARKIFPCLDRPDRKSRVQLTVRCGSELEVIANTAGRAGPETEGRREWVFEPTPPMPSYLFYLGIGRFDRAEDRSGRVLLRVLGPPGRASGCQYALDAGRRILEGFEDYYSIPYPLSKLDLIAVQDHAFGAMENWGAISFREVHLLIDENSTSFQRRNVFETISHEIAHQWFGNLVTMVSWDDIWLNESFASLMETRISERLAPSMDPRTDFFLRTAGTAAAFDGDSLPSTHPVRASVSRPEEISQIFDEISYGKGSTVLGMVEAYLGENRFRDGVTDYLERFRYGNARTEDLWDSLGRASGIAVGALVSPWIDRPGHPVIRVQSTDRELALTQERFSFLGSTSEEPWPIPMLADVNGVKQRFLFDSRTRRVPIPPGATVHLNPGAVGFYRVLYDAPLYERLFTTLPHRSPADRWSVVEDLGAFLLSGDVEWSLYERAVRVFGATTDRLVLESFISTLFTLAVMFPNVGPIQEVARGFLSDRIAAIGSAPTPGEDASNAILRERLCACRVRLDDAFARELSAKFVEWDHLDPNLRAAVAVARGRSEGASGWAELRRALEPPTPESEASRLESGLAWSPDPDRVAATLGLVESGVIARGHIVSAFVQVASNPVGRPLAWPWLQDHLPSLAEQFRGSGFLSLLLEHSIPLLGLGCADELRHFFLDHSFPEGSRGLAKGLHRLELYERVGARLRQLS
jgi:tricorn protease interacting factor F2/3